MGLILFPLEQVNERFLLKLRNCIVSLDSSHVLKKWITKASNPKKINEKEFEDVSKILTTKFNLITDQKQRLEVINFLKTVKGVSVLDHLLRSYLYLILGNVTESNNQLKSIYTKNPYFLFEDHMDLDSLTTRAGLSHLDNILSKLSNHPSDRVHFQLANLYLTSFFNSQTSLNTIHNHMKFISDNLMKSAYLKKLAPDLIKFKDKNLMNQDQFENAFLLNWVMPFIDVQSISKNKLINVLKYGIQENYLWTLYGLNSERLVDIALKETDQFSINQRRNFLRSQLENPKVRKLAVYKLIELGDIDEHLIKTLLDHYYD